MGHNANTWAGFRPVGYEIDWKRFSEAPLHKAFGDTRRETVNTTVGAVLEEVLPHRFGASSIPPVPCQVKEGAGYVAFETPDRKITLNTLNNTSAAAHFLARVVELIQETEASGDAEWHPVFFYYDQDHVVDDPHESFTFFAVNGKRIVAEHISVHNHLSGGFDPAFFKDAFDSGNIVWSSASSTWAAYVRDCYRRFYEETETGRLTALRDDVTCFHHTPEWRQRAEMLEAVRLVSERLASVHRWLVGVLLALGFLALALLLRG